MNNLLYNYLFDQLKFFECYHIFLNHILLVDQKAFFHHQPFISTARTKHFVYPILTVLSSNDRTKILFTPSKLGSSK